MAPIRQPRGRFSRRPYRPYNHQPGSLTPRRRANILDRHLDFIHEHADFIPVGGPHPDFPETVNNEVIDYIANHRYDHPDFPDLNVFERARTVIGFGGGEFGHRGAAELAQWRQPLAQPVHHTAPPRTVRWNATQHLAARERLHYALNQDAQVMEQARRRRARTNLDRISQLYDSAQMRNDIREQHQQDLQNDPDLTMLQNPYAQHPFLNPRNEETRREITGSQNEMRFRRLTTLADNRRNELEALWTLDALTPRDRQESLNNLWYAPNPHQAHAARGTIEGMRDVGRAYRIPGEVQDQILRFALPWLSDSTSHVFPY